MNDMFCIHIYILDEKQGTSFEQYLLDQYKKTSISHGKTMKKSRLKRPRKDIKMKRKEETSPKMCKLSKSNVAPLLQKSRAETKIGN